MGFFGAFLSKIAGPIMKAAIPLTKNILAPLGVTAVASTIDARIKKKVNWFWNVNTNNSK